MQQRAETRGNFTPVERVADRLRQMPQSTRLAAVQGEYEAARSQLAEAELAMRAHYQMMQQRNLMLLDAEGRRLESNLNDASAAEQKARRKLIEAKVVAGKAACDFLDSLANETRQLLSELVDQIDALASAMLIAGQKAERQGATSLPRPFSGTRFIEAFARHARAHF